MPSLGSELQAGILTLTLNRPERANAFDQEMILELLAALERAAVDPTVRLILLTGSGSTFSAGQDITEMVVENGQAISYREHLQQTYNRLVLQIRRIDKPVMAAINGTCAGAALGIALACDVRVISAKARLVVGFSRIGLAPDTAVSLLLPLMIGIGRAQVYYMTNEAISAQQALEWGMVNRIHADETFAQETRTFALQLAAGPVGAYGLAKQAFNHAVLSRLEEVLKTEADLQEIAGKAAEHQEGRAAFLEKRTPKYN